VSAGIFPSLYFPVRIPPANGDQIVVPYLNYSNSGLYSFSKPVLHSIE